MADDVVGDRISSLPDDILLLIVCFLSPIDKIRFSFLSKRFQKLWRSVPVLDFVDYRYRRDQFVEFIEKTLGNHENLPSVREFRLRCYNFTYENSKISQWIDSVVTASASNLEKLDIYVRQIRHVMLPVSVFSCQKLKFLRLGGHNIIVQDIPTPLFLPCLKTLKLESISILSNDIIMLNKLLSTVSPVLEISLIKDCSLKDSLASETKQSLKYLKGSWVQGESKEDPAFVVLKQLELWDEDMFEIVRFKYGDKPVFENLTHLVVEVDQEKGFLALPHLLEHSPNLTSLELKKASFEPVFRGYRRDINDWDAPDATVFKCLSCKLETVQINEFCGFQEVEVVKYFLMNAKVLKKLVLCVARALSDEIKASILDEPRASSQCEIEFRLSES